MEEDEQLKVLMAGLRGSNLDNADFAGKNVKMNLVEVSVVVALLLVGWYPHGSGLSRAAWAAAAAAVQLAGLWYCWG